MQNDVAALLETKIPDDRLRRQVLETPALPMSVFVELDAPAPKFVYEKSAPDASPTPRPVSIEPITTDDAKQIQAAKTSIEEVLKDLGVSDPVYLRSAQAFACSLNGTQIKTIALEPAVARIVENRRLGGSKASPTLAKDRDRPKTS